MDSCVFGLSWPPGCGRRGRATYVPHATVVSRQARSSPYLLSCHEQASIVAGHRGAPGNRSSKPVMPSPPVDDMAARLDVPTPCG